MMYKTFADADELPSNIDEVIKKACDTESVCVDLMKDFDDEDGKGIEFGLAMVGIAKVGQEGGEL